MGTMKIIGKAERKYTCDRMTISIHVIADEPTHDRAVQKCMNDSEALLKDLQSSGLELNQIKLNNHSVSTRHYDNKPYIQAERGIEIEAAFDMKLINHLTDLIQTNHYNADIRTGFSVSDLAGIHRQLIEEAFKDSRKKAEIIAALMGQKIAGIEKVEVGDRYDDDYLSDYQIGEIRFFLAVGKRISRGQLLFYAVGNGCIIHHQIVDLPNRHVTVVHHRQNILLDIGGQTNLFVIVRIILCDPRADFSYTVYPTANCTFVKGFFCVDLVGCEGVK